MPGSGSRGEDRRGLRVGSEAGVAGFQLTGWGWGWENPIHGGVVPPFIKGKGRGAGGGFSVGPVESEGPGRRHVWGTLETGPDAQENGLGWKQRPGVGKAGLVVGFTRANEMPAGPASLGADVGLGGCLRAHLCLYPAQSPAAQHRA